MTYREIYFSLIKENNEYLNRTSIKEILLDVSGYSDFISLLSHFDEEIKNAERLNDLVKQVRSGYPLQYALGHAYFVNGEYIVSPDVLIPRPETEQLAVATLTMIQKMFGTDPKIDAADIGTGSGVLAIYLKEKLASIHMSAVDISDKALAIANKNAELHKVKIDFLQGNMIDPLLEKKEKLDVLISNPPYIERENDIASNVFEYEPHLALLATPCTKFYEEIITQIPNIMKSKFLAAFEIGEDMEPAISEIIENKLPGVGYIFNKDMYNKTRFLYIIGNGKIEA